MSDETENMQVLIDGRHGIYIPQVFAETMNRNYVRNVDDEDWGILLDGPESELYWDTWDRVLNNAVLKSAHGNEDYLLYQDMDLFIYLPATVH